MQENEVLESFELLLEEIEEVVDSTNKEGAEQFGKSEYDEAKKTIERGKALTIFRAKVKQLQDEWELLESGNKKRKRKRKKQLKQQTSNRLKRGLRTPENEFRIPILNALVDLGGAAPINDVIDHVGKSMKNELNEYDLQPLPSTPDAPRWRNTAQWGRQTLVNDGLLAGDSPYGIWEITDRGREFQKENAASETSNSWPDPGKVGTALYRILKTYKLIAEENLSYSDAIVEVAKEEGGSVSAVTVSASVTHTGLTKDRFVSLTNDPETLAAHLCKQFPKDCSYIKLIVS